CLMTCSTIPLVKSSMSGSSTVTTLSMICACLTVYAIVILLISPLRPRCSRPMRRGGTSRALLLRLFDLHLYPLRLACHRVHMQHHDLAVVPVRDSVEPVHHALGSIVDVGSPAPFRIQPQPQCHRAFDHRHACGLGLPRDALLILSCLSRCVRDDPVAAQDHARATFAVGAARDHQPDHGDASSLQY